MNASRIALAVLALAAGAFWIAVGILVVAGGDAYGWGGVIIGAGVGARGGWIVRRLWIDRRARCAREAPRVASELVWPGGRGRGFDWRGEPLPSVAERVAGVRNGTSSSEG